MSDGHGIPDALPQGATTRGVVFLTTYNPQLQALGGAGWVDRRLLGQLADSGFEPRIMTVASPDSANDVQLELRGSLRASLATVGRLVRGREPYQEAKYRWHRNWAIKVGELQAAVASGAVLVTSQTPALLLAAEAGVRPDVHIAHNVDWVLAHRHSPVLLRLLGDPRRLHRRERQLLGFARQVLALSWTDVQRMKQEGVFARHLKLGQRAGSAQVRQIRSIGFVGKLTWPPNRSAVDALINDVLAPVNAQLHRPISLALAGKGSEAFMGVPNVEALGVLDDLDAFYSRIDLVVVPRLGETTGISIKLLDALERGCPVMAPASLLRDAGVPLSQGVVADSLEHMRRVLLESAVPPDLRLRSGDE